MSTYRVEGRTLVLAETPDPVEKQIHEALCGLFGTRTGHVSMGRKISLFEGETYVTIRAAFARIKRWVRDLTEPIIEIIHELFDVW